MRRLKFSCEPEPNEIRDNVRLKTQKEIGSRESTSSREPEEKWQQVGNFARKFQFSSSGKEKEENPEKMLAVLAGLS